MRILAFAIATLMLSSCVSMAPISVAWRSNASQQYATTEGKTGTQMGGASVNADRTTEAQSAVTTSSGTAVNDDHKSGFQGVAGEEDKK